MVRGGFGSELTREVFFLATSGSQSLAIWLRPFEKFDIHGCHFVNGLGIRRWYFKVGFPVVGEFDVGGTFFSLGIE